MTKGINENELRAILKENGLEETTELFSAQLTTRLIQQYANPGPPVANAGNWLGKFIIVILISFNGGLLLYLGAVAIPPVLFISLVAFIFGVWGIIGLAKRLQGKGFDFG